MFESKNGVHKTPFLLITLYQYDHVEIFTRISFLVAVLLFLTSFYLSYTQYTFLQKATRTEGSIIDYVEYCSGNDLDNCDSSPKIEFVTKTGEKIVFVNRLSSKTSVDSIVRHENNLNSVISVLYDPQNPQEARIDSFMNKWFLPIFSFTMGGLLLLFVKLVKNNH